MWIYAQKTGALWRDGQHVATGYAGCDEGKNDPGMQAVADVGPIPQGRWTIVGPPINTRYHGPYVLHLQPVPGTETFGRSGFLMHGDSVESPGCASKGCVILPRAAREEVWNSEDKDFEVVAEFQIGDFAEGAKA
jgi:hypothetical protein